MSKLETTRTIVMLASKLARSESRLRRCRTELNFAQDTNRELERELAEYRKEGERATSATIDESFPERPPIVIPPSVMSELPRIMPMSFGAAVELMCQRPGLEMVDNEGCSWRFTRDQLPEIRWGTDSEWMSVEFTSEWPRLTFHIAEDQP